VIRINLLPVREARRKNEVRQQLMMLAVSVIGAVLLCGVVHHVMGSRISDTQARVKALETQLAQFKPQQEQVDAFKAKKAEIEQKLTVIERLERSRSGPVHILDELASRIPERVWLTNLNANNGQVELSGMSLDNELIALFLTGLNDSPYFANVELEESELKTVKELKLNTFKIRAQLESPDAPAGEAPQAAPAKAPAGAKRAPAGAPARAMTGKPAGTPAAAGL
jgi:type IV pilus assembly protein PilN